MKRVIGIGGIFFKSADPKRLGVWYRDHLGLDVTDWGGAIFQWGGPESQPGMTIWSPFAQDTTYMEPSSASFMINWSVSLENLCVFRVAFTRIRCYTRMRTATIRGDTTSAGQ
jgi:hypothetical protein